ncbi:SDR family NAD(P)-dependent oxidoreductase [Candidatus Saccharibacteria bacterium]|nr:MAG: SDR family NAD(P)-dependent oxidoreductase [Candidatus Saccharibacteria bacterium]
MQKILITGGSGGIGYALARVAAAHGHDIVLAARNVEHLALAQQTLQKDHKISVDIKQADLSKPGAARKLYDELKSDGIEILVNNAGFGLVGDFFKEDIADNIDMVQLNAQALMELTHYFGNDFIKKKRGKILNVASVAAFVPGPKQPVYYATKAFVRSFSRALALWHLTA